ncbi:uncharacterized protein [Dermacentor albipictus]|uniref:uncharacterized protein n=1 Tax=Dermacentor albipictus TaxID=60249 RepID=UPI0038FC6D7C
MDVSVEIQPSVELCKVRVLVWEPTGGGFGTQHASSSIKIIVNDKETQGMCAQTELFFPKNVVFDVKSMTQPQESIVLRDRKEFVQKMPCREVTFTLSFHKSVGSESEQLTEPFIEPVVAAGVLYCFKCAGCYKGILGDVIKFRRITPLPSEDWKETSGEWFRGATASSDDSPDVLSPKMDELFTTAAYFIVNDKKLRYGDIDEEDGTVRCGRCHLVVGRKATPSSTALFTTRVTPTPENEDKGSAIDAVDASRLLRGFIKARLQLNEACRIVLASDKHVLLLWLMETGLQHFYAREVQCKKVCVDLQLAYLKTSASDALTATWKRDPSVGQYQIEEEVMEDTLCYFRTWCYTMGATSERFHVVFLPGVVAQA